jgi:flagellar biosynthesis/type III secretory pathway protein FliH
MIEIEKSPVIKMFTERARIETLAEGRSEGRAEAYTEAYTDALMMVIKRQYGKVGLQELEPQIRTIRDEKKLATLMEFALDSTSLEEFKKILANTI